MTTNQQIEMVAPKELPYYKFAELGLDIPYWKYRLPSWCDMGKLKVFKSRWGNDEPRLWFITGYIIPCDQDGRPLSVKELSNPLCDPIMAAVVAINEQGLASPTVHLHPISDIEDCPGGQFVAAEDLMLDYRLIGSSLPSTQCYFYGYKGGPLVKLLHENAEYLKATERFIMHASIVR